MMMKSFFQLLFCLGLLVSQTAFGQEADSPIHASWISVKNTMQRRSDIVSQLMIEASKSKKADKQLMNETRFASYLLYYYLDSIRQIDSNIVLQVAQKDLQMKRSLSKAMANLQAISGFYKMSKVLGLIGQLEVMENMVRMKRKEFNLACYEGKRPELELKALESVETAPEIRF